MRRHQSGGLSCIKQTSFLLGALLSLGIASSALAISHTITLDDFPATSFGCEFEAKELSNRLQAAGMKVISSRCVSDTPRTGTYHLSALIDRPIATPEETTYANGNNFYGQGWYKTLAECEADLADQTESFQIYTGLEPYVSYCSKKGSTYASLPYWPSIRAFGKPDLKLANGTFNFSSYSGVDLEDVKKKIEARMSTGDRRLVYSSIRNNSIQVGYYVSSQRYPQISSVLSYQSVTQCEENFAAIEALYSKEGNPPAAMLCSENSYGSQASLLTANIGNPGIYTSGYYQYFSSYDKCVSEIPKVTSSLQASGQNPLGVFCGYYYGYYMAFGLYRRAGS